MSSRRHNVSGRDPSAWFEYVQSEREAAVLQERRRFADELHDVVAARLQAAVLHLIDARQGLPPRESPALNAIAAAEEEIRSCWADARRSAVAMRPAELESGDLPNALAAYVARMSDASHAQITFSVSGMPRGLLERTELALLRAGQEALANAVRHAGAETISVELSYGPRVVRLDVLDNGIGFSPAHTLCGSGLLGMRGRAQDAGGELAILSQPGIGTEVVLTIPYNEPINADVQVQPALESQDEAPAHAADAGAATFFG